MLKNDFVHACRVDRVNIGLTDIKYNAMSEAAAICYGAPAEDFIQVEVPVKT